VVPALECERVLCATLSSLACDLAGDTRVVGAGVAIFSGRLSALLLLSSMNSGDFGFGFGLVAAPGALVDAAATWVGSLVLAEVAVAALVVVASATKAAALKVSKPAVLDVLGAGAGGESRDKSIVGGYEQNDADLLVGSFKALIRRCSAARCRFSA